MNSLLIKNASVVNEGNIIVTDVLIEGNYIAKIGSISNIKTNNIIDATGKFLLPGIIDAQVHFREPGLAYKGTINSETKAAIAGGVTSFMEMPNTIPPALTVSLLEEKYQLAAKNSLCNFSFFMGVNGSNENEWKAVSSNDVCGISDDGLYFIEKGLMLCSNDELMEKVFKEAKILVAIHSEDEYMVAENTIQFRTKYGPQMPFAYHALIHSEEACFSATVKALKLAQKYNTRLHILHLSTGKETALFRNDIPLSEKRVTTEVCIHHLWFCDEDYERLGAKIKWNPSIKTKIDREELWKALLDDRIDIITTDHAPHSQKEKEKDYFDCPSGAPMVQHSLVAMLQFVHQGKLSIEKVVEKMCHKVAELYHINKRGFIKEGYFADLVLVDMNAPWTVDKSNLLYKCGWSPFEGETFNAKITHTFVNGNIVYKNGEFSRFISGKRLKFNY